MYLEDASNDVLRVERLLHVCFSVIDVDECSLGQHQCGGFSRCYNTQGSYKCKCKEGYRGDGMNCMST